MRRRAWFYYQKQFNGTYVPVVVYELQPVNSKHDLEKAAITELVAEDYDGDEAKSFGYLKERYPRIPPVKKEEPKVTRQVSGYLTANGQFFETRKEAQAYDSVFDLTGKLSLFLEDELANIDQQTRDAMGDIFRKFIRENDEIVRDYINHFVELDKAGKAGTLFAPITPDKLGESSDDESPTGDVGEKAPEEIGDE